jgi:hypothetical protein
MGKGMLDSIGLPRGTVLITVLLKKRFNLP